MRILVTVSFSFAAALLAAVYLPWDGWQLYGAAALLLAAVVLLLLKKSFIKHPALRVRGALFLFSAAAALLWQCAYHRMVVVPVEEYYGRTQTFSVIVVDYPIETDKGMKVTVSLGKGAKAVYYG